MKKLDTALVEANATPAIYRAVADFIGGLLDEPESLNTEQDPS
jgi:hypothetical protein